MSARKSEYSDWPPQLCHLSTASLLSLGYVVPTTCAVRGPTAANAAQPLCQWALEGVFVFCAKLALNTKYIHSL